MFKKAMSTLLSLVTFTSFSVCTFASNSPVLTPTEEIHPIAIWGGVAACAIVVIVLIFWKNKDDDIDW